MIDLSGHAYSPVPAHIAVAVGRLNSLPQAPMSNVRVIFLAVLVVLFCSLFIGSYIWMRRPSFGQVEDHGGHRHQKGPVKSPSAPVSRRFSE